MWFRALVVLVLAGVAAIPAFSLAGGDGGSGAPGLMVTPSTGSPTASLTFVFKVPDRSGPSGSIRIGYGLSVTGPAGTGCVSVREVQLPDAAKGSDVSVTVDSAHLAGAWCQGKFTGRVSELATPVCKVGTLCPQFVRLVGIVASTTFRITAP